jgi:hypothetical protein
MSKLVQTGGTGKTTTRKTEVAQHRCRNCRKIGLECDLLARHQEVGKPTTKLPRNPLVYHEILLNFAMVCCGLQCLQYLVFSNVNHEHLGP